MPASDYKNYLGDNAVERFLAQALLSVLIPVLVWLAPDHSFSLFLQGRPLDGLVAIAVYGLALLGSLAYYHAERENVDEITLRRRYGLRVVVFFGSLVAILFFLPRGPAISLSRTASEDNVTVFLNKMDARPGDTVGVMVRMSFPRANLCDMTKVELLQDATAPGTTVFEQKGFDLDSDNNFFYSPFYGGCSCRFGFRVPKDFDRDAARFRITYMEATRRSFPWLVAVREGSAVRTVALYGQAPAR
jgi:hypothetical protein